MQGAWGGGGAVKKRVVRNMVRQENLDILCIQETKLEFSNHKLTSSLWRSKSGGLLTIWFIKLSSNCGFSFLEVTGKFWNSSEVCHLINVYFPCSIMDKHQVWSDLEQWKDVSTDKLWYFVGDFNSVLSSAKRK
ncbi:hypothetical protein Lal_00037902, partial [Lupinus albus]